MNNLTVFDNPEFGKVRTLEDNGKPLFCGVDIARALGYTNPRKAIGDHCKGVTKRYAPTQSGSQTMSFIPEGDVYRLITHSKLPSAERFESWVFDEVLPALRRTGTYSVAPDRQSRADAMLRNAKSREAALWLKIAEKVPIPEYQQICAHYASGVLAGKPVFPLPESGERHLSATEIGEMFGVSAQKVGSIAKANGLKTPEYGKWYHDKSPHSPKEVDTFKYNAQAVERFKEFLT